MTTVEQAKSAMTAAKAAHDELLDKVRKEADEARAAVWAKYQDELDKLNVIRCDAEQAVREAKNRMPDHEWTGKRVYRMVNRAYGYRTNMVREYGIVETRRIETKFPYNTADYRMPSLGDGFVRLLKKDNTVGSKFDSMYGWTLDDETSSD